jgi:tRNA(Ile)-lysidine synthase
MAGVILPSGPGTPPAWSSDHLRLHRSLLRRPELLPRGAPLLLAVSGGQDSMAMTGLLRDLQSLHHWRLHLWHGDHGWRDDSAQQASELQSWARSQQLPIRVDRQEPPESRGNREALARCWRYQCLQREALRLGCRHVLTAHTASDRAETVLLHLARGSHRRGLVALRRRQPLAALLGGESASVPGEFPRQRGAAIVSGELVGGSGDVLSLSPAGPQPREPMDPEERSTVPAGFSTLWLVRPLQAFTRQDTERICRREGWPIWQDATNAQLELSRNRIRAQVLPVLEQLHPGAARRISDQAERLAAEEEQQQELLHLALIPIQTGPLQLDRRALLRLSPASQGLLLQHWLRRCRGQELDSRSLAALLPRLVMQRGPGRMDLSAGWQLCWRGTTLALRPPRSLAGHG